MSQQAGTQKTENQSDANNPKSGQQYGQGQQHNQGSQGNQGSQPNQGSQGNQKPQNPNWQTQGGNKDSESKSGQGSGHTNR
jgi:hypothetical protein